MLPKYLWRKKMRNAKFSFDGKVILVTGGTGSFGRAVIKELLTSHKPRKVIVFSRDEWKQWDMRQTDTVFNHDNIRYFLGDVRDKDRLRLAFKGVDCVIHAAALKQVPAAEYNPSEYIKTNVNGAMNIIDAAIECNVDKVIAISTDKAVNPANLYGATKLCSDKLFIAGNVYVAQDERTRFSVVRYGNVIGSRGSIMSLWRKMLAEGATSLPITHEDMTRFWISLDDAVAFVLWCFESMLGGEIFVPKIESSKVIALADKIAPGIKKEVLGIRPGEKLHEKLISREDALNTYEAEDHYVILSRVFREEEKGLNYRPVPEDFEYSSF
jgi:UDP-N-acetylglucosamine 4,6-dehydratase/5-epimerase